MTRLNSYGLFAIAVALAGSFAISSAAEDADQPRPRAAKDSKESASGEVALTFEKAAKLLTPSRAVHQEKPNLVLTDGEGSLTIAGQEVKVALKKGPAGFVLAVDANGDGKLTTAETARIDPKNNTAIFEIKAGSAHATITLFDIRTGQDKAGKIVGSARVAPVSCMKGTSAVGIIRLVDDNLDGKFTQDGKDAVAFGASVAAVPLLKNHCIQDKHYELEVAEDGSKVTLKPLADMPTGQVKTPFGASGLKCLVLASKTGAYDVSGPKATVPPGDYQMVYGAVGTDRLLWIYPSSRGKLDTMTIEADKVNSLKIGPPFRVDFDLSVTAQKGVTVSPMLRVVGSAGEEYGPLNFSAGAGLATPMVQIGSGEKVLGSGTMEYG